MFGNPSNTASRGKDYLSKVSLSINDKVELRGDTLSDASVQMDNTMQPISCFGFELKAPRYSLSLQVATWEKTWQSCWTAQSIPPPLFRAKSRGHAQITGNFTLDEAKLLAVVLRSGALPAL